MPPDNASYLLCGISHIELGMIIVLGLALYAILVAGSVVSKDIKVCHVVTSKLEDAFFARSHTVRFW